MGDEQNSDHARTLPGHVRDLLDPAPGAEQDRAWTGFVDAYSRLLLHVARQTPGDYDDVMDRFAFALERLREQDYRRLRTYAADGRGKFTTWLMVVVRRLCLDFNRLKHGRYTPAQAAQTPATHGRLLEIILDPRELERLPDEQASAAEELEKKELLTLLAAAVAALSPRDQLLLALRYHDDRSALEIASILKLPTPFHVYRRLNRVHAALREWMTAQHRNDGRTLRAARDASAVQSP